MEYTITHTVYLGNTVEVLTQDGWMSAIVKKNVYLIN